MGESIGILSLYVKEILATKCEVSMLVVKYELCLLRIERLYEFGKQEKQHKEERNKFPISEPS
jgi:hypothetical protein